MVLISLYWFLVALALALTEIEIEGKHGWAEKTATWSKRVSLPKGFFLFSGSRVLTGYHIFLNIFLIIITHSPLVFFKTFSWSSEFQLISTYLIWALFWDLLWFIFNPYYGWKEFAPNAVWWFGEEPWLMNKLPLKYFIQIGIGLLLITISSQLSGDKRVILDFLILIATFIALTLLSHLFLRRIYHSYYWRTHKKTD